MSEAISLRRAAAALFGPGVWAGHFLTIYAAESLACRQSAARLHDLIVLAATLVAIIAIVWHRGRAGRRLRQGQAHGERHFQWRVGTALAGLSLIGIGWAALAAAVLGACR